MVRKEEAKPQAFDMLWISLVNICRYPSDYDKALVKRVSNLVYNVAQVVKDDEAFELASKL